MCATRMVLGNDVTWKKSGPTVWHLISFNSFQELLWTCTAIIKIIPRKKSHFAGESEKVRSPSNKKPPWRPGHGDYYSSRQVDTVVALPSLDPQIPQVELLFHGRRLTTGGFQGARAGNPQLCLVVHRENDEPAAKIHRFSLRCRCV